MAKNVPGEKNERPVWWYGLIGGLVAMPLTVGHYWLQGSRNFSLLMVLVGGMVAGYLAVKNASRAKRAGSIAGCVGALPGVLLFLPALLDVIAGWIATGSVILSIVAFAFSLIFILGAAALVGLIGGAIGGWLASASGRGNSPTTA